MKAKFTEIQKFTQWWVWLIMVSLLGLPVYAFLSGGLSGGLKLSPVILVVILFYLLKLKTEVDEKGVRLVYFPFVNKFTEWTEIKSVSVINYGFVGGWGIRFGTKYGTVYNVNGNKGMLIELNSGKTFVIGTQKEAELKNVLKELGKTK
jgi:hypothetical protein